MPRTARVDSPGTVTRIAEILRLTPIRPPKISSVKDKLGPLELLRVLLTGSLVMATAMLCFGCKSENRVVSNNINGVTARFEIETPTVHFGEALRVTAFYRNTSSHSVTFRFLPATYAAKVYYESVEELPCIYPDVGFSEVVLNPGQEIVVKDEMTFSKYCYQAGPHEIRFYYHASLLGDSKLEEMYLRKYSLADRAIAWEDRGHKFTIKK
jgi:hypothetical protein